jgi:hypothetical protein
MNAWREREIQLKKEMTCEQKKARKPLTLTKRLISCTRSVLAPFPHPTTVRPKLGVQIRFSLEQLRVDGRANIRACSECGTPGTIWYDAELKTFLARCVVTGKQLHGSSGSLKTRGTAWQYLIRFHPIYFEMCCRFTLSTNRYCEVRISIMG